MNRSDLEKYVYDELKKHIDSIKDSIHDQHYQKKQLLIEYEGNPYTVDFLVIKDKEQSINVKKIGVYKGHNASGFKEAPLAPLGGLKKYFEWH